MKTQMILAFAALTIGVNATEIIKADGEKGSAKKVFQNPKALVETEEKVYSIKGHNYVVGKELIEIKPGKKYVLKGKFRTLDKTPKPIYLGLALRDANKRIISPSGINAAPGTETTLAAACKKTDKVIKLKDASKWKVTTIGGIAFKADPTGKYKDLPNRNLSKIGSRGIVSVKKVGDVWEVTLKGPVGQAYPAGTVVRQHNMFGGYMYCAAANKRPGKKMKEYKSKVISKVATHGASSNTWWPGTKYANIVIIVNYGDKTGKLVTEFDDIVLEETD